MPAPSGHFLGKNILVTGAAKRLGYAIALGFAKQGGNIIAHSHTSPLENLGEQIEPYGGSFWPLTADLSNEGGIQFLAREAILRAGKVDILINNAATFAQDSIHSTSFQTFSESLFMNAWAPVLLGRLLAQQGHISHILNVGDTRASAYDEKRFSYQTSKLLLQHFTKVMAIEFAPSVQVNAVAPGLVLAPEGAEEQYTTQREPRTLLRRRGNAAEVVEALLYLARSQYITGQVISVDGGELLKATFPFEQKPSRTF